MDFGYQLFPGKSCMPAVPDLQCLSWCQAKSAYTLSPKCHQAPECSDVLLELLRPAKLTVTASIHSSEHLLHSTKIGPALSYFGLISCERISTLPIT